MIIWFSGTGNSRLAAGRLAARLGEPMLQLDAGYEAALAAMEPQRRIVWVCPVYGWRIPPLVERAIAGMSDAIGRDAIHWLVVTCGDDVGLTPRYWRRLIGERQWQAASAYSVAMPNTYVFLPGFDVDKPEVAAAKLAAAPGRLDSIARAISGGEADVDWVVPGALPGVKSRLLCPPFRRWLMRPGGFGVDAARCIGCGNCVRACPMDNVELDADRRPGWGSRCAFCTACYHACPQGAVIYGIFSRGKGRYLAPPDFGEV